MSPKRKEQIRVMLARWRGREKHNQNTHKTICVAGHKLEGSNVYLHESKGVTRRHCRNCKDERQRRARAAEEN